MSFDYEVFDNDIQKKIQFKKIDLDRDGKRIHRWMMEDHVHPFWNLNISLEKFQDHLRNALADRHQTLYAGYLDGVPMSYWEAYWVKGDVVEETYTPAPFDQGVHLLIGEREYLGKGLSLPLLRAMVSYQFQEKKTTKVVAEPDVRNDKMIHVFEKCGFEKVKPVTLPDKTGLLMFCERSEFEKRWQNEGFITDIN